MPSTPAAVLDGVAAYLRRLVFTAPPASTLGAACVVEELLGCLAADPALRSPALATAVALAAATLVASLGPASGAARLLDAWLGGRGGADDPAGVRAEAMWAALERGVVLQRAAGGWGVGERWAVPDGVRRRVEEAELRLHGRIAGACLSAADARARFVHLLAAAGAHAWATAGDAALVRARDALRDAASVRCCDRTAEDDAAAEWALRTGLHWARCAVVAPRWHSRAAWALDAGAMLLGRSDRSAAATSSLPRFSVEIPRGWTPPELLRRILDLAGPNPDHDGAFVARARRLLALYGAHARVPERAEASACAAALLVSRFPSALFVAGARGGPCVAEALVASGAVPLAWWRAVLLDPAVAAAVAAASCSLPGDARGGGAERTLAAADALGGPSRAALAQLLREPTATPPANGAPLCAVAGTVPSCAVIAPRPPRVALTSVQSNRPGSRRGSLA